MNHGGIRDAATFGRARRRRRIERLLNDLDRQYTTERTGRQRSGVAGRVVRGVGIPIICLLVSAWWVAHYAPRVLPTSLQQRLGVAIADAAPRTYADGSFAFLKTQPNDPDTPVGFNPCRRIAIKVNLHGAPPHAIGLVRAVIADVRRASGLDLVFTGTTTRRPTQQSTLHSPVLVAWATDKEVPRLEGDVAGLGGAGSTTRGIAGTTYYTGGMVTLDADAFRSMARPAQHGVVAHEFGHLVGLAHVASKRELMHSHASGRTTYGHGDLTGLARLGRLSCS